MATVLSSAAARVGALNSALGEIKELLIPVGKDSGLKLSPNKALWTNNQLTSIANNLAPRGQIEGLFPELPVSTIFSSIDLTLASNSSVASKTVATARRVVQFLENETPEAIERRSAKQTASIQRITKSSDPIPERLTKLNKELPSYTVDSLALLLTSRAPQELLICAMQEIKTRVFSELGLSAEEKVKLLEATRRLTSINMDPLKVEVAGLYAILEPTK